MEKEKRFQSFVEFEEGLAKTPGRTETYTPPENVIEPAEGDKTYYYIKAEFDKIKTDYTPGIKSARFTPGIKGLKENYGYDDVIKDMSADMKTLFDLLIDKEKTSVKIDKELCLDLMDKHNLHVALGQIDDILKHFHYTTN